MAEINIYGYIGEDIFFGGVSLQSVSEQLSAITDNDLTVNISSGGGSVNEGKAIYTLLKNSGKNITVKIIGQAYSIASVIAMCGNKILIGEFADMMIHPAWTYTEGNADDLRETADMLEKMSNELFDVYMTKDGLKKNETKLREYFDSEKIISAKDCIELGLADGYLEDAKNTIKKFIPLKAVAYYSKPIDMKKENAEEAKSIIQLIKDGIKNMFTPEVNNASKTAGDTTMYYDGEFAVGTKVFSDEAMTTATPDGTYGDVTVSGGEVSSIAAEAEDSALAEAIAKVAELQNALDQKETALNELKAANELKEAENKSKIDAMMLQVEKLNNIVVGEEGRHKDENTDDTPKVETMSQKMKRLDAENRAKYSNIN